MNSSDPARIARALFEASAYALFLVAVGEERITDAIAAAARLFAQSVDDLTGRQLRHLLTEPLGVNSSVNAKSGSSFHGLRTVAAGNKRIPVELQIRLPDAGGGQTLYFVRDCRAPKSAEALRDSQER